MGAAKRGLVWLITLQRPGVLVIEARRTKYTARQAKLVSPMKTIVVLFSKHFRLIENGVLP